MKSATHIRNMRNPHPESLRRGANEAENICNPHTRWVADVADFSDIEKISVCPAQAIKVADVADFSDIQISEHGLQMLRILPVISANARTHGASTGSPATRGPQ